MKILITGAGGQLGYDLVRVLSTDHELIPLNRKQLDVANEAKVMATVQEHKPDAIIHAAAYTQVDAAEKDAEQAYQINASGTWHIAQAARLAGIKLVYVSTDYIFDGRNQEPYQESNRPNPLNVYGNSKLLGEKFTEKLVEQHFIVRTSWLYGRNGRNFVTKILDKAKQGQELKLVVDQMGSPTYTWDLAKFIGQLIVTDHYGTYHAANLGFCSRYEFGIEILHTAGFNELSVTPIQSDEFELPAERPEFSAFDDLAIRNQGLPRFRDWKTALHSFINQDLTDN